MDLLNQVVLSPKAWEQVQDLFIGVPNVNSRGLVNLIKPLNRLPELPPIEQDWTQLTPEAQELSKKALLGYIPRTIKTRLDTPLEQRPEIHDVVIASVGVGGLDYEAENILEQLQKLVQAVQEVTNRYEGALGSVTVDDKGTVIWLLFDTPPSIQKDNAVRAAA